MYDNDYYVEDFVKERLEVRWRLSPMSMSPIWDELEDMIECDENTFEELIERVKETIGALDDSDIEFLRDFYEDNK